MERTLTIDAIQKRIRDLAVGLAADCDAPEEAVEAILRARLPDAERLPFVAILTHDGQWVGGYSGSANDATLLSLLDEAQKSGKLEAPGPLRAELAKLADAAAIAATAENWPGVLKAVHAAAKSFGRCEERERITAAEQKARAWVAAQFQAVIDAAVGGAKLDDARKRLKAVSRAFAGEPEAAEAELGVKAIAGVNRVRAAEARGSVAKDLRPRLAKEFEGSRWTKMFEVPEAKK